jgi:hypothetical protein
MKKLITILSLLLFSTAMVGCNGDDCKCDQCPCESAAACDCGVDCECEGCQ